MIWFLIIVFGICIWSGLSYILITLICDIPLTRKLSKTHTSRWGKSLLNTNKDKLDLWEGPTPYGKMILTSIFKTVFFLSISYVIYYTNSEYSNKFIIAVIFVLVLLTLTFYNAYDPDNPHNIFRRDYFLAYGEEWFSNILENSGTLLDEQYAIDMPNEILKFRNNILEKEGFHSSEEANKIINTLSIYDKPMLASSLSKNRFLFKKILLEYSIYDGRYLFSPSTETDLSKLRK